MWLYHGTIRQPFILSKCLILLTFFFASHYFRRNHILISFVWFLFSFFFLSVLFFHSYRRRSLFRCLLYLSLLPFSTIHISLFQTVSLFIHFTAVPIDRPLVRFVQYVSHLLPSRPYFPYFLLLVFVVHIAGVFISVPLCLRHRISRSSFYSHFSSLLHSLRISPVSVLFVIPRIPLLWSRRCHSHRLANSITDTPRPACTERAARPHRPAS